MERYLTQLERLLEGINYTVFLGVYEAEHEADTTASQIISKGLGWEVVLGNTYPISSEELITEVRDALYHSGDKGHGYGPFSANVQTVAFDQLCDVVIEQSQRWCEQSNEVTGFWIKEGHPAYPVFWDFAFLFRGTTHSRIFIGSSSD